MKAVVCDRCGKLLKESESIILALPADAQPYDMCKECFNEFQDWMGWGFGYEKAKERDSRA